MDIDIRLAGTNDLQTIHEMAEIVFRETYRTILSPEQMDYMMEWMYSLPNLEDQVLRGHVYYIAWAGDEPQGYVSVRKDSVDADGTEVWHLEKHVRDNKMSVKARIELNVNRNNPAVGFYRNQGFSIIRQGDFPIGNGFYMNDYIMGTDIR